MRSSAADLGLVGGMGPRPLDDLARADHGLALVEDEDGHVDLPRELPDLLASAATLAPGPGGEAVAGQVANLVLVSRLVERPGRPSAGVPDRGLLLLLSAGVEDHAASLSRRPMTSGTCSRYAW